MRILVCGSRKARDRGTVWAELDDFHRRSPISRLIHGGAAGVDTLARDWAIMRGIPCDGYPVTRDEWKAYGRGAGPRRNARMLREGAPEMVIAFPGGAGTANMVNLARAAGVPIQPAGHAES